jgi:hypothetical protein
MVNLMDGVWEYCFRKKCQQPSPTLSLGPVPTVHQALTPSTSSEIYNAAPDISLKGKRKMINPGEGDTDAHIPAGNGRFKRNRITTVAEEDSDIEYIGSWRPPTRTKTAVKMENMPIKLENSVSDSGVSAKPY